MADWIGQHDVEALAGIGAEAVVGPDGRVAFVGAGRADAVQEQVQRAQTGHAVDDLHAAQGIQLQMA
jgi:hypothetical protein